MSDKTDFSPAVRIFISKIVQACIKLHIPPPGRGGNKIKVFGNEEGNQRDEKSKKYYTFGSTKMQYLGTTSLFSTN